MHVLLSTPRRHRVELRAGPLNHEQSLNWNENVPYAKACGVRASLCALGVRFDGHNGDAVKAYRVDR